LLVAACVTLAWVLVADRSDGLLISQKGALSIEEFPEIFTVVSP
jgi:hypothetical protein